MEGKALKQLGKGHKNSEALKPQQQGLHISMPGLLHKYCSFQFNSFYGTPECVTKWVSDSCAHYWNSFLFLFACYVQLRCDGNCFILLYFILLLFISTLVEAFPFQSRKGQKGSGSGEWVRWGGTGRGRGGKTAVILYVIRKKSLFN